MKPRCAMLLAIAAFLQSILALGTWFLWYLLFSFMGPGIDFDKPGHQVTVGARVEEATLFLGLPVAWSTAAAVLLWLRKRSGWWLAIAGDFVVALAGVGFLVDDIPQFTELGEYPSMVGDVAYHFSLVILPILAITILFSRAVREWSLPAKSANSRPTYVSKAT